MNAQRWAVRWTPGMVALACLLCGLLLAAPADARTVSARGHLVARIGALDVDHGHNSGPADAEWVFGPALTLVNTRWECKLRWPGMHATLDYVTYGAASGPGCGDTFLQVAYLGRSWQTKAGLKVGASLTTLRRIYRHARHAYGRWALLPYASPIGGPGGVGSPLWAVVRHGHVSELQAFVGDAGE